MFSHTLPFFRSNLLFDYIVISQCLSYFNRSVSRYTRVSQVKTLNIFYLVMYSTQKVHNDFIFFYIVSYCHLSATFQNMNIIVETYKTIELWFEILSHFYGFHLARPRIKSISVKAIQTTVLRLLYRSRRCVISVMCE